MIVSLNDVLRLDMNIATECIRTRNLILLHNNYYIFPEGKIAEQTVIEVVGD